MSESSGKIVTMYSTAWCPDCVRAKHIFKRLEVPFEDVDIDTDQEGYQLVVEFNGGKRIVPTIFFPDGTALVEPSNAELVDKLAALGLVPGTKG